MNKYIPLIGEWEPFVFPTRTFIKEIAYWVSLFVGGFVFMVNIMDASTGPCGNDTCFTQDIIRSKEYSVAALAFLFKHVVYTVDTYLLLRRKVALPLDFATNANHLLFWVIIVIFGLSFTSLGCGDDTNIFKCGARINSSNNGYIWAKESRWPLVWLAGLVKLIADIALFIYFQFVQKRRLSVAHGQTVSVIALDLQYFLVCLWFNNNWQDLRWNSTYYYDAKVLFIVLFVAGLLGFFFGVICVILGYNEWKGQNSMGAKNSKRAYLLWLMASWWFLAFLFLFVFDGTAGNYKSTYKTLSFILVLVMLIIGSIYGVFNILAKRNLEFTGYDLNNSMSRSHMGPNTSQAAAPYNANNNSQMGAGPNQYGGGPSQYGPQQGNSQYGAQPAYGQQYGQQQYGNHGSTPAY